MLELKPTWRERSHGSKQDRGSSPGDPVQACVTSLQRNNKKKIKMPNSCFFYAFLLLCNVSSVVPSGRHGLTGSEGLPRVKVERRLSHITKQKPVSGDDFPDPRAKAAIYHLNEITEWEFT